MGFAPAIAATTYKVAVLRIDFSDNAMTTTLSQTESLFSSFRGFYDENSYGVLTVTATLSSGGSGGHGALRMPRKHSYYAAGIFTAYDLLAEDALEAAQNAGMDLSSYNHIVLYHAGQGAETTHDGNIWSAYLPSGYINGPQVGDRNFEGLTVVPEAQGGGVHPLGVLCHEYGHQLGLPDLYNTSTGESSVGVWSLMDYGTYSGSPQGSNPSHLDAWSKQFLGFSSPETITLSGGLARSLAQAETTRGAFLRVPIMNSPAGPDKEYFLVEYRRKSGAQYDRELPGEGVLIWHVDDSVASNPARLKSNSVNSGKPNHGVRLIPASSFGVASNGRDLWPQARSAAKFSSPKSNGLNGKNSGVEIENISAAGGPAISMTVKTYLNNAAFASNRANGGVVIAGGEGGFVNPDRGESAQIGLVPANSTSINIKILTVNGDLIAEKFAQGLGGNQSFVSWDGKDAQGNVVASGIYFVKIEGGGIDVVKKVAVVR
ncbi:MAG: hypothetical protein A2901_06115 [Elusimicrobia bacterium RIFCSPLOWO2_01_FULL_54_10]|nr:MAG: hypothetical protein A2901_06115 [Elusimicrobia bacterium RIFCSPLOWO2_01_FULL_54_10]